MQTKFHEIRKFRCFSTKINEISFVSKSNLKNYGFSLMRNFVKSRLVFVRLHQKFSVHWEVSFKNSIQTFVFRSTSRKIRLEARTTLYSYQNLICLIKKACYRLMEGLFIYGRHKVHCKERFSNDRYTIAMKTFSDHRDTTSIFVATATDCSSIFFLMIKAGFMILWSLWPGAIGKDKVRYLFLYHCYNRRDTLQRLCLSYIWRFQRLQIYCVGKAHIKLAAKSLFVCQTSDDRKEF